MTKGVTKLKPTGLYCVSSLVSSSNISSDGVYPNELRFLDSTIRSKRQVSFTGVILQGGECVLPPHPDNGAYTVSGNVSAVPGEVYQYVYLYVTCNTGFIPEKEFFYCFQGFWSDTKPQCVRFCHLKKHDSITYHCLTPGIGQGSRVCGPIVPNGTIVKPVCSAPDYYYPGFLNYMTCDGDKWNYIATCTPVTECGKITPPDLLLVIGGDTAYKGELPWHVGIYKKINSYEQICGGSLVSTTIVISAAHCFWSDRTKLLPASLFAVAAGKIYRQWNDSRDSDAQKSDVLDIKVSPYFQGAGTNYQDDIAIVVLATPFRYRASVRPVCVDFDEVFSTAQLNGSALGKVGGWGLVGKNGQPSEVLKAVELPYVNVDECFRLTPRSFKEYITSDKMCAGYMNGTALCQGDSGGGLAFPATVRGVRRYYLRGVVSTAPKNADLCSANSLTAFTAVIKHEPFVRKYIYGGVCTKDDMQGVCTKILNCKSAIEDIIDQRVPPKLSVQLCSSTNNTQIVCCLDNSQQTTNRPPVATRPSTTPKRLRTTTEPPKHDFIFVDNTADSDVGCEPISSNLTAVRTGEKAWDKCIEYQHKLIYPCEKGVALINKKGRINNCNHNGTQLNDGGLEAGAAEFPHMVLLGLEKGTKVGWLCGGTLISERFILTAAHCTSIRGGKVQYARTHVLDERDAADALHLYRISDVITHPEYKQPIKYNDIALLKTERDIMLDQFVVPACLDVGRPNNQQKALATGWEITFNHGDVSNIMQKFTLDKFTTTECSELFVRNRNLEFGFDEHTQLCYGDRNRQKNFCTGNGGSPLQVYHEQIHCMYTVVGLASFGRRCIVEPTVYTRVAPYVRWIESIVWP